MTAQTGGQGTAQPGRASPLDSAAQLPIDGLPREALLAFSAQMASLIRHTALPDESHSRSPEPADDSWAPFFELDIEVQLALIAMFRPEVAAAPLRGEIARLAAGASVRSPGERVRIVSVVKAALATINGWWARLQGAPGVSGLGPQRLQVALLAPFGRQLRHLVQQLVVGPLQDLLSALPELFEVTRGLDPALWGPVAQSAKVNPGDLSSGTPIADLLSRLTAAIQDTEQRLVADARGWLASQAVQNAARPPHMALLLAFLDLLESPRSRMNAFALNHLRYYYETVLGQTPRGPQPDRTFVVFGPVLPAAPPRPPFVPVFLPRGTALAASKDAAGQDRTYQLLADVQVDLAAVVRLLTLTERPNPNHRSGQGLVATDSAAGSQGSLVPAEVGFALSSAVFALAGGHRRIRVTLQVDGAPAPAYFNVRLTGPDGWIQLDQQAVLRGSSLTLDVTLTAAQPAVVGYRSALHGPLFADGTPPVLCFVLDEAGSPAPVTALASVTLSWAEVTVTVDSTPAIQLAGPTGPLALGKPFAPLGYAPPAGAALLVACPEALEKKLTRLTLQLTWQNLPAPPLYPDDIGTYYAGYELGLPQDVCPDEQKITRSSFKVALSYRLGGAWQPLTDKTQPLPLFGSLTETAFGLDGSRGHALPTPAGAAAAPFKWQPLPPDGVLQIQLVEPSYGFGAALYPIATAELARRNLDYVIDRIKNTKSDITSLPPPATLHPPLTPLATDLTVCYEAEARLEYQYTDDITLYRVSPWLAEPVTTQHASRGISPEPVPLFSESVRGCVLLAGIKEATPGRSVGCLLVLGQHGQLAAGPATASAGHSALSWHYLGGAGVWTPLRVEDRTGQLCRSGIVSFEVPADAADWSGMRTGLLWIKAEVTHSTDYLVLPSVTGVFAQASECARVTTSPGGAYDVPLPAGTIVGLTTANPRIASVSQPLPTSGGRRAEDQGAMYRRVSERTRHKNRAVTAWDFERLALERYPSLFAVRCLPGIERQPDGGFRIVHRGVVTLLVSPRVYDPGALSADRYPPMVDDAMLGQIQQDLASLASASAEIQVWNPDYVPVTVTARLTARAGQDPTMIGPRLNADLRAFLSPWIFQLDSAASLGGPESAAQVRRFFRDRPDIQTIQMDCRLGADPVVAGGSLRLPATPWKIPVSAWQHDLVVSVSTR
jgi:Baseplate J-like protein